MYAIIYLDGRVYETRHLKTARNPFEAAELFLEQTKGDTGWASFKTKDGDVLALRAAHLDRAIMLFCDEEKEEE